MKLEILEKRIIEASVISLLILSLLIPIGVSEQNNEMNTLGDRETLEFYPKSHDFGDMYEGEVNSTVFEIWRGGGCCEITYELFWDEFWVDVFPTSGVSNGEHDPITVTVDTTGLGIGIHYCDITIQSSAGNGIFNVTVNVIQHGDPTLAYYPQSYHFGNLPEGVIDSTEFDIWNTGVGTLCYSLSWDEDWVDVSPTSGDSTGEHDPITVTIDTTGFEEGSSYTSGILIESNGGDKVFTVMVNVGDVSEIVIGDITGGLFKIKAVIKNTGTCDVVGVDWKISLDGGFILLGEETTGRLPYISQDDEVTITSDLIIGFGSTAVTVEAEIPDGEPDSKTVDAKVMLFLIFI